MDVTYSDYLGLDRVLSAQHPLSGNRDELLFIIQHQTAELWMKLVVRELAWARDLLQQDEINPALRALTRVIRIVEGMVQAWGVLVTMAPADFAEMRGFLGSASGIQSDQYRQIQCLLGKKPNGGAASGRHLDGDTRAALEAPSLYEAALQLLARRGLPIDAERLRIDPTKSTCHDQSVQEAWMTVYRTPGEEDHADLHALGERLLDLEDVFRQWQFRHVSTVERLIGHKVGTGGTSGVSYLRKALDVVLFPELWQLRMSL